MFRDDFKERYTTIPFAIYREHCRAACHVLLSHQHGEIELIAMTEGRADFYIDTKHYALERGDVLIIPPYAIHRAEITSGEPVCYNCICFDPALLWDREIKEGFSAHTLAVENPIRASHPSAARLGEYVELGCVACEGAWSGWEMEAIGATSLFFGTLKREGFLRSELGGRRENELLAERVMNYISAHYAEPITSSTAAATLYLNNSYFCRTFRRTFGCRFSDYLLAYRLEQARLSLVSTSDRMTEISYRVGFHSSSYFAKAFRERFGVSPLQYRMENPRI